MSAVLSGILALILSAALTPIVRRLARAAGLVDAPDGHRKLQARAVPLGGGVAILVAAVAAIATITCFSWPGAEEIQKQPNFAVGLLGAALLICMVGLLDDFLELRGRQKLAAQMLAVLIVVLGGLRIERVELFGYSTELGLLAIPVTAAWLLGAINSLNLIDGVDGLAGTVGAIVSIALAGLALMMGHVADAAFAGALAGAILGFLIYNLPPARIYLGDAGSMTIGLTLGALAIRSSLKGPATVAMAAPTAIWAILMFDVLMAILRRKLTGQSVYASDRSHLHHVLQKRGYSNEKVVLVIGLLSVVCVAGALVSVSIKSEMMALGTSLAVLAMLVVTGFFGRSEVDLLVRRCRNLGSSMFRLPHRSHPIKPPVLSRFQGSRDWDRLWSSLVDYANRFDVSIVQLNVSSPAIGEEYHATWQRKAHPPLKSLWRTELPLFRRNISVGRLTVSGDAREGSVVTWMTELIEGLRPFELQLGHVFDDWNEHIARIPMSEADRAATPAGLHASKDALSTR